MTFPQQWFRTRRRAVVHILFHSPCTSYFRLSPTTARKAASAFHFSPLVFSPLFFQYPWPRRPLVTSHTRSPLGRAPGFTLTPVIFVIPGDFSFVYFVHTEPRARHAPLAFGRCGDFTPWPSSYWAFIASALRMRAHVPIVVLIVSEPPRPQLPKTRPQHSAAGGLLGSQPCT